MAISVITMAIPLITMADPGDHDGDLGDHDAAISVITIGRYTHLTTSAAETRPGAYRECHSTACLLDQSVNPPTSAEARFQTAGFRWKPTRADIETAVAVHGLPRP